MKPTYKQTDRRKQTNIHKGKKDRQTDRQVYI
uniref:Uncharacterized protein n=1 Tax=Scylla paramamosain TaxID=85552 RepID=D2DT38_SCYPA|nr:hypothetical protein [Scylla paramamosain]